MTTFEIGKQLVELCRAGKNQEAKEALYAADIVSIEVAGNAAVPAETKGLPATLAKGKAFVENHTIHSVTLEGPFPNGDRFIVRLVYDVTHKPSSTRRTLDEAALYTVKNGKIVREEFFYTV